MEFLRSRKSAVVTLSLLLMIGLVIFLVVNILNKPVNARIITTAAPTNPQAVLGPQPVSITTAYATFSYPNSMHPMADPPSVTAPTLASYNYIKADILTWHLAINFTHLVAPNLSDDSSYLIRKDNPSEFTPSTITYGNNTFTVMTDNAGDGFGEAAFILHGDTDAIISLTGNDAAGTSGLDTAFQLVLKSWQWN